MKTNILLLQPRHTYAPNPKTGELGQVYMPTSLLAAAARLLSAGVETQIVDENIAPCSTFTPITGINLIGAPYVSRGVEIKARLKKAHRDGVLIVGGQGASGFGMKEKQRLFGADTVDGNNDGALCDFLKISQGKLPAPEAVSLIPAYNLIPDGIMQLYLSHEFSFYLSQGCRYSCTFCAAERTRTDPESNRIRPVRERYRSLDVVDQDLRYLLGRAKKCGLSSISFYLSNLDLFQSPKDLSEFAALVLTIRKSIPEMDMRLRALGTTTSFIDLHRTSPQIIEDLVRGGLYRVGFGIDGATPGVWRAVRKPHRTDACLDALRISREEYRLVPETLMVFGHNGHDDLESLKLANDFLRGMAEHYGAIPRPHVAKDVVPGNDGWQASENQATLRYLFEKPHAFQLLDFTALPSWLTHPDPSFRRAVSDAFLQACSIEGASTQFVYPEDPELPAEALLEAKELNLRRYDL
jgi:hypothetical protein